MHKPSDMATKVALVTGAASGLGRATALALAKAGANICAVDINQQGLDETAQLVREEGVECHTLIADLSRAKDCHNVVAAAVTHFSRLDALCNVAGVIYLNHSTAMPEADWEKTIAVNLSAPFYLSQAAIPHLLEQNGAIVNVSSAATYIGEAYAAAYCASKAGLTHLTKAMAMEYIHQPIRINAIAPGGMATNITASMMNAPKDLNRDLINRFVPLRGMVEVEDVADLIAFLSSDAASGYHGACIAIDKGIAAG